MLKTIKVIICVLNSFLESHYSNESEEINAKEQKFRKVSEIVPCEDVTVFRG